MLIHSNNFRFSCPNAPNCSKVLIDFYCFYLKAKFATFGIKYFLKQPFNTKSNSQRHFVNCRAVKPSVNNNKEEDDSTSYHSSFQFKRNFGPRRLIPQPAQQLDESKIIWKEYTVLIKRTDFIEKAIWLGYSSLTRLYHNKSNEKKSRTWVNTAQICAGTGPKKRKT